MWFEPSLGVGFPRCVGHGGVPVLQNYTADAKVPPPGTWQLSGFLDLAGQHWALFGFAVLDLAGGRIRARYLDENGKLVREEDIQ